MLPALALLAVALLVFFELPLLLALLTGRRDRLPAWVLGTAVLVLCALVAMATRNVLATLLALLAGMWTVRRSPAFSTGAGRTISDRTRKAPTVRP